MESYQILVGDCAVRMTEMADSSVDSIVTDPPYGLGFMGKAWDSSVPAVDVFAECLRVLKPGGHLLAFGGSRTYHRLAVAREDAGFEIRDQIMWIYGSGMPKSKALLKPAHEPIVMARKLAPRAGSINIGLCLNGDRWPANVIHDGSDEVMAAFPNAKGQQGALTGNEPSGKTGRANCYGVMDRRHEAVPRIDSTASAARFFYCAKASKKDRGEGNRHPTVKPTELMRYLCRLVTPPGGVVLDPFAGSGSTGKAAVLEGFSFIGIEIDAESAVIAESRIITAKGGAA